MGKIQCHRKSDCEPHTRQDAVPHTFILHFFGPAPGKTPWWARWAGLTLTHCSVQVGEYMIDLPVNGACDLYHADQNLAERFSTGRSWIGIEITSMVSPSLVLNAMEYLMGLKHQRIRTMLYHLHLWPKRPVNCLTPMRVMMAICGLFTNGRTPDEICLAVRQLADRHSTLHQETD